MEDTRVQESRCAISQLSSSSLLDFEDRAEHSARQAGAEQTSARRVVGDSNMGVFTTSQPEVLHRSNPTQGRIAQAGVLTAAEFFAGIGLVRLALEREGWTVTFANDIDVKKFSIYRDNFKGSDFLLGDIRQITADEVPTVDLATASFPCIDLSLAGNRAGLAGAHSSAFWEFARILDEMGNRRPAKVLLENVTGLITSHGGKDLSSLVKQLNNLGYVCDLLAVDASYFVPQSRPRLFIIGKQGVPATGIKCEAHPARPELVRDFLKSHQHLRWALALLPQLPVRKVTLHQVLDRFPTNSRVWWDSSRKSKLWNQMNQLHRSKLHALMNGTAVGFATVYKRIRENTCRAELRTDGIAGCLRTPRGGSSKQFVIQACRGDWNVRTMTAREYGLLQGVPRSYRLSVPENQALMGFGDAVCVPAVQWVIKHSL